MLSNKKAEEGTTLGGTVVGIVIAVLCIGILLLVGVAVYNLLNNNPDLPKAEATLDEVLQSVKSLSVIGDSHELLLYSPKNWALVFEDDLSVSNRPTQCGSSKCLCMCKYSSSPIDFLANCNNVKTGICSLYDDKKIIIKSNRFDPLATTSRSAIVIESANRVNISLLKDEVKIEEII